MVCPSYTFNESQVSWVVARQGCLDQLKVLAEPRTEDCSAALRNQLRDSDTNPQDVWLGATGDSGGWRWSTDGAVIDNGEYSWLINDLTTSSSQCLRYK